MSASSHDKPKIQNDISFFLKWQGLDTKGVESNDMFSCKLQTHNVSESAGFVWWVSFCRFSQGGTLHGHSRRDIMWPVPGFRYCPLKSPAAPFQMTPASPDLNSAAAHLLICPLAYLFVCLTKWKASGCRNGGGETWLTKCMLLADECGC